MGDPVSAAASVAGLVTLADVLFNRTLKYLKDAKGAKAEINSLCDGLQNLSEVLHSLAHHSARLDADTDAHQQHDASVDYRPRLVQSCAQLLGTIQKKLDKHDPTEPGLGVIHSRLRQLRWPFSASEVKELLEKMEKHKSTLQLAVEADTFQSLQEILSTHRSFQNDLVEIKSELAKQRKEFETHLLTLYSEKAQRDIYEFFGSESPEARHRTSLTLRHPETGLWLLEDDDYLAWVRGTSPKLWLTGIPGAGKTVLASLIIEEAWKKAEISRSAVAYFYCDYKDTNSQDTVKILGSIATQLAQQSIEAFELLRRLYEQHHPVGRMPAPPHASSLVELVRKMSSSFEDVAIIVDGLDECGNNTRDVSKAVHSTDSVTKRGRDVKIALLSRSEQVIRDQLERDFVHIQISARSEDIRLYVATEMETRINDGRLEVNSEELKEGILKALVDGAEGMFRWAACQMDYLCEQADDYDRWRALKSLPPDLDATYERILARANSRNPRIRTLVQRTLRWLIYSRKKLTDNELCLAVSIDPEMDHLNSSRQPTIRTLLTHCSSLIRRSNDGAHLELAHFTVQEFLTDQAKEWSPHLAPYFLPKDASNKELAITCLTYLNFSDFDKDSLNNYSEWRDYLNQYPLRQYFVDNFEWYTTPYATDDTVFTLLKRLFQPIKTRTFARFAQDSIILDLDIFYEDGEEDTEPLLDASQLQGTSPLHLAAMLKNAPLCRWLINEGCSATQLSPIGSTLHYALLGHRVYMYKLIMPVTEEDEYYTMDPNEIEVLRILADAGADGRTPFVDVHNVTYSGLSLLLFLYEYEDSEESHLSQLTNILLSAKAQVDENFFNTAKMFRRSREMCCTISCFSTSR